MNYEYEERAAILEFDGGLSREDAERQAAIEIEQRMKQTDERQGLPSASGIERLALCPGSWEAEKGLPNTTSEIAEYGTKLHAALATGFTDELEPEEIATLERVRAVESELLQTVFNGKTPDEYRERRMWYLKNSLPLFSGQIDVAYQVGNVALIIEYKFGYIPVASVSANLQLRSQAVLASRDLHCTEVYVAVIQPHCAIQKDICHYTATDLAKSAEQLEQIVRAAEAFEAPRVAGEAQCKYCKAKAQCPVAIDTALSTVTAIAAPEHSPEEIAASLTDEQLSELGEKLPFVEGVVKALKARIKTRIEESPGSIRGYGLKHGGNTREITNTRLAYSLVKDQFTAQEFSDITSVSVPALEKAWRAKTGLKKSDFDAAIAPALTLKPKAPSLERLA